MNARLGVLVLGPSLVLFSLLGSSAYAEPPTQERTHFDNTVRLVRASNICGFDVFGHFEGDQHFTLFYDRTGAIDREVDTFPDFKVTVFAPSTGKSYTSASPAVLHTQYTDGAAIGSPAIAELTGLVEKVDGVDIDSGRLVFNGRASIETTRAHHPSWRRGGVAARGARAAINASDWLPSSNVGNGHFLSTARISPGSQGGWLCRGRKRRNRVPQCR